MAGNLKNPIRICLHDGRDELGPIALLFVCRLIVFTLGSNKLSIESSIELLTNYRNLLFNNFFLVLNLTT